MRNKTFRRYGMERVILHSDLNNFFASVECRLNPSIADFPVAVTGDVELRHGIVLAKNNKAKKYNVQTCEAVWEAKQKCPGLVCVPPHYEEYNKFSKAAREIYSSYTDLVESYGIDECWLDVSASGRLFGSGEKIAREIRSRIKKELGVTVSVGVSFNKVFAKLGSDMKKPDATTVIDREHFKEKVWPLGVGELLYVGRKTEERLCNLGINTIGKLAATPVETLRYFLGKNGEMLNCFANGLDISPVANINESVPVKSVSCGNTAPRDLVCNEDIRAALIPLCTTVSRRLREYGFLASTVGICVRDSELFSYTRQKKLPFPCRNTSEIIKTANELFIKNHKSGKPVRSLTVQASGLIYNDEIQLSLEPEMMRIQQKEYLDEACDRLNKKYGAGTVCRASCLAYPDITLLHVNSGVEHSMPSRMLM